MVVGAAEVHPAVVQPCGNLRHHKDEEEEEEEEEKT